MIRIAFFDIDGTILDFGAPDISPRVYEALRALQRNGVRIFIATGRCPYIIPHFPHIHFDGILSFNGSYCFDGEGLIFSNKIDPGDVRTVIDNAKSIGEPVLLATDRRMGSNFFSENLEEYMQISLNTCNVVSPEEYQILSNEDIYQMMVGTTEKKDGALLKGTSGVRITRWWDRAADVIPRIAGKALGMEKILEYYDLSRDESIAFGDGGNDLDMIEYAGVGVAMGNAVPEVQAAADYVTDCCADDGVYKALKHFGLI